MTSPACRSCRHWDTEHVYRQGLAIEIGKCLRIGEYWEASEWIESDDEDIYRSLKPECKDDLAFAQDGSDYVAYLVTRPDFFCAHFEERN